ncbi:MAG: HD-GYP domain-containing protein [Thermoleophilia bacterium]|nr:HD-GYP domain-containing protein [Thermoleophilia bacterium]
MIATVYLITTGGVSLDAWALLGFCLAGCAASLLIPWQRAERWWVLPMIVYASVVISSATILLDKPGITTFHLFPLLFLAYFYWGRWRVILTGYVAWAAMFVAVEIARDGGVSSERLVVSMPTYIAASAIVGLLANSVRDINSAERKRFKATVEALGIALSGREGYTGEHSPETLELVTLVRMVTAQLALGSEQVETITDVALLHDIGKIGIPSEVLSASGKLDERQRDVMKQHPVIGEHIVARIPGLEEVARAIRHEHERWDGKGYPDGLKGSEIPLASRIVLVCDAYHAMTRAQPYRSAMSDEQARAEMVRHAGTKFDPIVVVALLAAFDEVTGELMGQGERSSERMLGDAIGQPHGTVRPA